MGQGLITAGIMLRYYEESDTVDEAEIQREAREVLNDTVRETLQACGIEVN